MRTEADSSRKETKVPSEKKDSVKKLDYSSFDADAWGLLISYWRACPDKLLDVFESENPLYDLEIIQRVIIRACCNKEEIFITGGRGLTKTYCVWLSAMLEGILYPGTLKRYFGPSYKMSAELASLVYKDICLQYPGLSRYWNIMSDSIDRFEISTRYGSVISINAMNGDSANSVIAEECSQEIDKGEPFNHERYRKSILPSIRKQRKINRQTDINYPNFQKTYITSAGRQQNPAFSYRKDIFKKMIQGKNAFCIDIPGEAAVLSHIRDIAWYKDLNQKLTPDEWMREMASVWTGTSENPVIRDTTLTESQALSVMETRHCLDPEVIYIIGYDVSYVSGETNAKCATAVLKCSLQTEPFRESRFMKDLVYVMDEDPPSEAMLQARRLKERWYRFCMEGGQATYIAIDSANYGEAVLQDLHKDLGDGLPPLCCVDHSRAEIELDGALPVIYPIKATTGSGGKHDPDGEMIKYAELEFEHRNVRLLTTSVYDGVTAYKRHYHIKDDHNDPIIQIPYKKTQEMCVQISNLRKKVSGITLSEERISKSIQRDMWSALKYALRYAQILEYQRAVELAKHKSSWTTQSITPPKGSIAQKYNPRIVGIRRGGNMIGR